MTRGTQIAYIPNHAKDDITHEDVEFGFVTSENDEVSIHFCRFWRKGEEGKALRTTSCSEAVSNDNLRRYDSVSQHTVDKFLATIMDQYK
jgi:hypothetical protein